MYAGSDRAEDPWGEPLALAREAAQALRERRDAAGSLEVESSEPVFEFGDDGNVVAVHREQQTESHSTIEQLMVLANEQVAGHLSAAKKPTLYRVHERPDPQSVVYLMERLESLGVPTPPIPEHMSPQQAADAVAAASHLVAQHVRRTGHGRDALTSLVLRSLKQAYYSPDNIGHAGLASPNYLPLHVADPPLPGPRRAPGADVRPRPRRRAAARRGPAEAGEHSSAAEREAMQIERDADDVCMAFLLERVLHEEGWDQPFEGEVVGLVGGGAFVRFGEPGFEGFLPARAMRGEWWDLNEQGTALIGERTGSTIKLGDPVSVGVRRVEAPRGRVDLVPAVVD